jgi:hypothetical protein
MAYNEQGFLQVGEIAFRPPGPLLIENILMKLRTKVQRCLSSQNQCLALQFAEVCLSSPTCKKPHVIGRFFSSQFIL